MARRRRTERQLTTRQRKAMARLNASYAPIFEEHRDELNMKPKTILAKVNHRSRFFLVNSMGDTKEVSY